MYLYHYALHVEFGKIIAGSLEYSIKLKTNEDYAKLVMEIEKINILKIRDKDFVITSLTYLGKNNR